MKSAIMTRYASKRGKFDATATPNTYDDGYYSEINEEKLIVTNGEDESNHQRSSISSTSPEDVITAIDETNASAFIKRARFSTDDHHHQLLLNHHHLPLTDYHHHHQLQQYLQQQHLQLQQQQLASSPPTVIKASPSPPILLRSTIVGERLDDDVLLAVLHSIRRERNDSLKRLLGAQLINRHMKAMTGRLGLCKKVTIYKNSRRVELNGVSMRASDLTRRLYFILSRCRRISSLHICPFNGKNVKMYERSLDVLLTNKKICLKRLKLNDHDPDVGNQENCAMNWIKNMLDRQSISLKRLISPLWLLRALTKTLNLDYLRINEPSTLIASRDINPALECLITTGTCVRHLHLYQALPSFLTEHAAMLRLALRSLGVDHLHLTFDVKADLNTLLNVFSSTSGDAIVFDSVTQLTMDTSFVWPAWSQYLSEDTRLSLLGQLVALLRLFPNVRELKLTMAMPMCVDLLVLLYQLEPMLEQLTNVHATLVFYDVFIDATSTSLPLVRKNLEPVLNLASIIDWSCETTVPERIVLANNATSTITTTPLHTIAIYPNAHLPSLTVHM